MKDLRDLKDLTMHDIWTEGVGTGNLLVIVRRGRIGGQARGGEGFGLRVLGFGVRM